MGTINSQTSVSSVTSADQMLIWDTANGEMRKASVNVLTTYIAANLGDAEADSLDATGQIKTGNLAVALLPAASGNGGARAMVYDSNATLAAGHGNVVAAGGANIVPVYCDGTNWRIG